MKISQEEKDYLVEQIKSLTSHRPLFYLKFCSCEKYCQDVCNGDFYGNTAEFFRNKEIETGERGQGDQFELLLSIQTQKVKVIDNENGKTLLEAPEGMFKVQFKDDDIKPIISFVGIPLDEMVLTEVDETHATFILPFTEDEYETMTERFGEHCVLLGGRELEDRIESYCKYFECDYIFDKVEYCDQNRIDRMQAVNDFLRCHHPAMFHCR